MTAGSSPRSPTSATALPPAALLQSQFGEHQPRKFEEVDRACMQLWVQHQRDKLCKNCLPFLTEAEAKASAGSTGSPTSSSTSVASSRSDAPALDVKPANPMLMSSQLGYPPFVSVQSSKTFIIRMMHLWIATATTWCLEQGWNWAVEYLEGEDWLKLTPTHTTLWVAIASSVYAVATHTCDWYFPNPSAQHPPTRAFLKTLKFLTCIHVAAAISSYFKAWVHPFKGIICMGVAFAMPYNSIESWGGLKR